MNRETFKNTQQSHLLVYQLTPRKAFLRRRDLEQYPSSGFESTDPLEKILSKQEKMHFLAEEVTASPRVAGFFGIPHWGKKEPHQKYHAKQVPGNRPAIARADGAPPWRRGLRPNLSCSGNYLREISGIL